MFRKRQYLPKAGKQVSQESCKQLNALTMAIYTILIASELHCLEVFR